MKMTTKRFKWTLLLALPVIAALAIPGEAASVSGQDGVAVTADTKALPQEAFGLFLDPHVEPVLHFAPPAALWDL
jgi:hypothetical protein